ncbi:MAG TPA: tRNA lysidine(34) synthetase TilS [Pseudonocardia sp.]|jgi:tRNA(Ile)-lysidine synthase|nr:tRNA lysidine(34) synthetase TilS [Pseudonocardia sp.]
MSGPHPAVAAVRTAVRHALTELACPPGTPLLVACSGGADSMALALAATAEAARTDAGWPVRAAVVDHGLQPGSAERAETTVALLAEHGVPAEVHPVRVTGTGGVEAAARRARYTALRAARPSPASPVLLGHTLDDQAETVLLGLGRGSGPRSMAGMTSYDPPWLRPLLGVRRATTRAACAAWGVPVWDDPHNADPRFTRVRLRTEALPLLEDVLAGGVAEALARTAAQLREDGAALDEWAALARAEVSVPEQAPETASEHRGEHRVELEAKKLAGYPASVRRRVLRSWLIEAGASDLTDAQLRRADDLVGRWRGQGGIALAGELVLARGHGRLVLGPRSSVQASEQARANKLSEQAQRTSSANKLE